MHPHPKSSLLPPTHTLARGPNMAASQSPASRLGNESTTPSTKDCLSCRRRTPTWACVPCCGGAWLGLGRGQQGPLHPETPSLPAQAQAGQGCGASNRDCVAPDPSPSPSLNRGTEWGTEAGLWKGSGEAGCEAPFCPGRRQQAPFLAGVMGGSPVPGARVGGTMGGWLSGRAGAMPGPGKPGGTGDGGGRGGEGGFSDLHWPSVSVIRGSGRWAMAGGGSVSREPSV